MFKTPKPIEATQNAVSVSAQQAIAQTEHAIDTAEHLVEEGAHAISTSLDSLRERSASALARAATQADELARKSIAQAKRAGTVVREKAQVTGENTVAYIRDEPVKSVVMAVVAGAALAWIFSRTDRSRASRG